MAYIIRFPTEGRWMIGIVINEGIAVDSLCNSSKTVRKQYCFSLCRDFIAYVSAILRQSRFRKENRLF